MTCTATPTSGVLELLPDLLSDDAMFGNSTVLEKICQKQGMAVCFKIAVQLRGRGGTGKALLFF
jgi:hypothetical protein